MSVSKIHPVEQLDQDNMGQSVEEDLEPNNVKGIEMVQMIKKKDDSALAPQEDPSRFNEDDIKSNHSYISFFSFIFLIGSTLQVGWTLSECNQVGMVLDKKLGWNVFVDGNQKLVHEFSIIISIAVLGICIGSYLGGQLMPKYGGRTLLIMANSMSIIFNALKLIEKTPVIFIGRFFYGLMTGIKSVAFSKAINDTVPAKNQGQYGGLVNSGISMGVFFSNFLGLLIPLDNGKEGDVQKMLDDQNWRLVLGFPILLEIIVVLTLLFIIKHESIIDLLQEEDPSSELLHKELKKVYTIPADRTYEQLAIKLKREIKLRDPSPCTVWQAVTHKKYRRASWNGLLLGTFTPLAGIGMCAQFQTQIFLAMEKEGRFPMSVIWAVQLMNIANVLASFVYGALSKYFRQKSALLFGQFFMALSLLAVAIFAEYELNGLVLVGIVSFYFFFNYGIAPIAFIHTFETCVDSITGMSISMNFFFSFITIFITPMLLKATGVLGTFAFFGGSSMVGFVYFWIMIKDTSLMITSDSGEKYMMQMTEKDKKELYWPEEYKSVDYKIKVGQFLANKFEVQMEKKQMN